MVILKYSESYKAKKARSGLYIVIALCLLIIGGAAWFAVSKYSDKQNSEQPLPKNEYNAEEKPYNDGEDNIPMVPDESQIPTPDMPSQTTNESVENVPFEQEAPKNSFALPVNGEVIKEHSEETLQYSKTFGDMRLHYGIDIACQKGTTVTACSDGRVISVEASSSYGKAIVIEHNGITVKYCALDSIKVKQGDTVKLGDAIGVSATVPCECLDDAHIHLEVLKDGKQINPLAAFGLN